MTAYNKLPASAIDLDPNRSYQGHGFWAGKYKPGEDPRFHDDSQDADDFLFSNSPALPTVRYFEGVPENEEETIPLVLNIEKANAWIPHSNNTIWGPGLEGRRTKIPVSELAHAAKPRTPSHVQHYVSKIQNKRGVAPIWVHHDGEKYHVIDGHHRLAAHIKTGATHVHALEMRPMAGSGAHVLDVHGNPIPRKGSPGLEKSQKPYGHTAYHYYRNGKLVTVEAKGVRPMGSDGKQFRAAKHMHKRDFKIAFLDDQPSKGMSAAEADFFNHLHKKKVSTLPDFLAALNSYLREVDPSHAKADKNEASEVIRSWMDKGYLAVVPGYDETKKPHKEKPDLWKSLENPGIKLPEPYKPRGLKVAGKKLSPEAEEMAWSLAPYLMSSDPRRQPDAVFLQNFLSDFSPKAGGLKLKPNLNAFRDAFHDVIARRQEEALAPKAKPPKIKERTPKTHPSLFAKVNGEWERFKARSESLLKGRIFTGVNPKEDEEETGLNLKNISRGKWVPPVKKKDVFLNGSKFPPDAKQYGGTETDPKAPWVYKIKVPKHANEQGWLYSYRDILSNAKWDKVAALAEHYDEIMDAVRSGLQGPNKKVCAAIAVLDGMHIRVGGKAEGEGGGRGLTDLTTEHIWIKGDELHYYFNAKSAEVWDSKKMGARKLPRQLITTLRSLGVSDKPVRGGGKVFEGVTPAHLNEFLKQFDDVITCHKFRHFHANRYFKLAFDQEFKKAGGKPPRTKGEAKRILNRALWQAGLKLGHIIGDPEKGATTARNAYIHPVNLRDAMERLGYDLRTKVEQKNELLAPRDGVVLKALYIQPTPPMYETYFVLDWAPPPATEWLATELNNG